MGEGRGQILAADRRRRPGTYTSTIILETSPGPVIRMTVAPEPHQPQEGLSGHPYLVLLFGYER
jgi:hypothetical protein